MSKEKKVITIRPPETLIEAVERYRDYLETEAAPGIRVSLGQTAEVLIRAGLQSFGIPVPK